MFRLFVEELYVGRDLVKLERFEKSDREMCGYEKVGCLVGWIWNEEYG